MDLDERLRAAAQLLREADALLVTAGAGMGVDSGLPDFRGNEGFWKAYPPMAKLGVSFVEMANPWWFDRDPSLAWGFYGHRLNLYRRTVPHEGFKRLLEIGNKKNEGYFVFTSNVDGQFQIAGFDEDRIEECHGSLHHLQCSRPCSQDIWEAREVNPGRRRDAVPGPGAPAALPEMRMPWHGPTSSCSMTGTGSRTAPGCRVTGSAGGSRGCHEKVRPWPRWNWAPARPWQRSG